MENLTQASLAQLAVQQFRKLQVASSRLAVGSKYATLKNGGSMMGDSNTNKTEQLGMSFGKANQRLRKMIMFMLAQKCSMDSCFRCGEKIEDIGHLSIEHKLPWEGRDVSLFWDLDNIAFSHLRCNRPYLNRSNEQRRVGPDGTAWCRACKKFLPESTFSRDRTHWNGVAGTCNPCSAAYKKAARRAKSSKA